MFIVTDYAALWNNLENFHPWAIPVMMTLDHSPKSLLTLVRILFSGAELFEWATWVTSLIDIADIKAF